MDRHDERLKQEMLSHGVEGPLDTINDSLDSIDNSLANIDLSLRKIVEIFDDKDTLIFRHEEFISDDSE